MAQQDTGLGWSADSAYLLSVSGAICNFNSLSWNTATSPAIPAITSDAVTGQDVVLVGLKFAERSGREYYIAYNGVGSVLACYLSNGYVEVFSNSDQSRVYFAEAVSGSYFGNFRNNAIDTGVPGYTGLYRRESREYVNHISSVIPEFSDLNAAINDISSSGTSVYKLNSGTAVVCCVKWRDFAPATYWTPFIISTDEEAAKISLDGTTEYYGAAKAIKRYDGLSFYISYIRGIDGEPTTTFPTFDANAEFVGPGADSLSLNNVFDLIASERFANILVNETIDPYAPFGNTEEGGGEVDPDPEDDDIEEPPLPGLSFAATGLCRIYRADLTALNQLANYMWTDNTFLQTLVNHAIQLIENPMDAIISLCLVPVEPPSFSVGTAEPVSVMYIPTPSAMWPVINQFARVDCGTLYLKGTYGSALDYNPYTKVSCFLPYIGFVDLDTDEVMEKTLNVVYRIDVVTGVCVAMIKVNGEVMYQFSGHCAIQMPLSSADFSTVISSLLQAGKLVAGAALTAAGAPEVGGMLLDAPQASQPSTTVHKIVGTERNPATGKQITKGTFTETFEKTGKPLALGELTKRQSANTVGAVMNSKFGIEHSGGFSGNSGYLGVRRPFIIVKYPNIANPEEYGQLNGRPSMMYLNLGVCTGYTEVQSVQLTGIAATNSELSEIATLLKTGVIL